LERIDLNPEYIEMSNRRVQEKSTMFDSIDLRVARTPRDLPREEEDEDIENGPVQLALLGGLRQT
jgi:hypothetical protein